MLRETGGDGNRQRCGVRLARSHGILGRRSAAGTAAVHSLPRECGRQTGAMGDFVFDPRVFILPPFKPCPKCGCEECFGVLMIGGTQYTRRCRECWYDEKFPLPEVHKRVVYLDQMAISNMTKLLHPVLGRGRAIDPFWRELFERIDVLCKLQVLICPESQTHREESALAPFAAELRRMYELFSHGTTFNFSYQIRDAQLVEHLRQRLAGAPAGASGVDVSRVMRGKVHGWQERFTITVGGLEEEDWPERLRESRERTAEGMAKIHERWRREEGFDFERTYRRELRVFGEMVIRLHLQSVEQQARMLTGLEPLDVEALLPSNATSLVLGIHHQLREAGVAEEELWRKTGEFLCADSLDRVPYMQISCLLFAALARKAAIGGQVRPPNRGMISDVTTVAAVLPYCDAIWVDNEVAGLLNEEPLRTRIDYGTRVFSWNTRHELLNYLDELRAGVDDRHVELVREVYGEGCLRPFTALFEGD